MKLLNTLAVLSRTKQPPITPKALARLAGLKELEVLTIIDNNKFILGYVDEKGRINQTGLIDQIVHKVNRTVYCDGRYYTPADVHGEWFSMTDHQLYLSQDTNEFEYLMVSEQFGSVNRVYLPNTPEVIAMLEAKGWTRWQQLSDDQALKRAELVWVE
jgi:hypothetical protein